MSKRALSRFLASLSIVIAFVPVGCSNNKTPTQRARTERAGDTEAAGAPDTTQEGAGDTKTIRKPDEPRRLEFAMANPKPIAVDSAWERALVSAGCESIVYDLSSGKRLHSWNEKLTGQFSAGGRYLLTIHDRDVLLFRVEDFRQRLRLESRPPKRNEPGYRYAVRATASDDASQVAVLNHRREFDREQKNAVLVFDGSDGQLQHALPLPETATVGPMEFLTANRIFLQYTHRVDQQYVRHHQLWNTSSGKLLHDFTSDVLFRVSPDGSWIAAGPRLRQQQRSQPSGDQTIKILNADSGETVRAVPYSGRLRDLAFGPNSERLCAAIVVGKTATAKNTGQVIEWDVATGKTLFNYEAQDTTFATVMYSPDGERRFATTEKPNGVDDDVDHQLVGWNVDSGVPLPIQPFAFGSYNGEQRLFLFFRGDRFIDLATEFAVRDVLTGETTMTFPQYRESISDATFLAGGEKCLVGREYSSSMLTDIRTGKQRRWSLTVGGYQLVDNGRLLFSGNRPGALTDVISGRTIWSLALQFSGRVAVSPNANYIVMALRFDHEQPDGQRVEEHRVMRIETARPYQPLILSRSASAVAVHPESTKFLAASNRAIEELDIQTGEPLRLLWKPPGPVTTIAYSPDGAWVFATGVAEETGKKEPVDPSADFWTVLLSTTTDDIKHLRGHSAAGGAVAFSADGSRCVTGSRDKTVRLWDTSTGETLHVFRGHLGAVHAVALSPRADLLLSAAQDGAAIWNVPARTDAQAADPQVGQVGPFPIAESFTVVESIHAPSGRFGTPREPLFPVDDTWKEVAGPSDGQASWEIIELGEIRRQNLLHEQQHWLRHSGITRRLKRNPVPVGVPRSPLWNYDKLGTSLDGDFGVFRSGNQVVVADQNEVVQTTFHGEFSPTVAGISPSATEVVIYRSRGGSDQASPLSVYDSQSGKLKRILVELDDLTRATIAPNEQTILLNRKNRLVLRDYQTGEPIGEIPYRHSGGVLVSEFSSDSTLLATCKFPAPNVDIYDATTAMKTKTLRNSLGVRWFRFTPDGKRLLAGQEYARRCDLLTMWDVQSGRQLWSQAGSATIQGTFSDDGRYYLSDDSWGLWTLWDLQEGHVLCAILGATAGETNQLWFSKSGDSLHLGSPEGRRVWPK